MIKSIYTKHRHFFLYVMIGGVAFIIDATTFFTLSDGFGLYYLYANMMGVFFGISISFILNSRVNFKKTDQKCKRILWFFSICLLGMTLGTLLLSFFFQILRFNIMLAKLLSVMVTGLFQYVFNKHFTFAH